MKAWVTQRFNSGKPYPRDKKFKVFEGDLNMADSLNRVLCRLVSEASLLTDDGVNVIASIVDVRLVSISADGILLRGMEYGHDGKQVAQEWWVRFQEKACQPTF